jgi:CubicO group peptidase (beta-lactamase class C family)
MIDFPSAPLVRLAAILALALPLVASALPDRPEKPNKLADDLLARLGTAREPGAGIIALRDGRVVYLGVRGVADMQAMRPIDGRTAFRLASVTKQFTAAAVMLLVKDGKLRYEDRLTDLFPGFPAYGRAITVRHLLTHTSGIADYEDLMPPARAGAPVEESQIDDPEIRPVRAGRALALQQFRLRPPRARGREGLRPVLPGLPPAAHLRAAQDG